MADLETLDVHAAGRCRQAQVDGERRHTLGSSLRETAFYLRIQQQPSRCLPAFHYSKQRLGPEAVPGQRKGKLQLQIGRRLAKRLLPHPAYGHLLTEREEVPLLRSY